VSPAARLQLTAGEAALFASDMHLGDHDPDTAAQFFSEMDAHTPSISHLFLLGDVFEAWVGDDQPDQVAAALGARIAALTARGVIVALMRGNRDFLLGTGTASSSWPERFGAQLLGDLEVLDLFGQRVLIAHGDSWCTDDHAYQRFRAEVRSSAWQQIFLAQPLAERLAIARRMREQSELNKQTQDLGDVNDDAVREALRAANVRCVIHGHTHRPGRYLLGHATQSVKARAQSNADQAADDPRLLERWVLPDWLAREGRRGMLRVDAQGWRFTAGAISPPSG
jgi:UDP-2,3-diacylglucosamine hydrolase